MTATAVLLEALRTWRAIEQMSATVVDYETRIRALEEK
jgi:hypothetical protein